MNIISKRKNFLLASFIFAIVLIVYIFTLAPIIAMEDSAEFVTAAYVLGVPHPPGFPLYVLLGKLFTFVPLGTIAWRVNLMSAFFGALTVALLYLLINKIIRNRFIAFCCSLILAFSQLFWSQSIVAEVYTLNSFFVVLLLIILISWAGNKKDKYLLWFSFVYGLSLTNHTMMSLFAPAFFIFILLTDRKILTKFKLIAQMFLLFCLGLSVYIYLPLRAMQNPPLNFGRADTFKGFLDHITRRVYNDFSVQSQLYSKLGLAVSFLVLIYEQFFLPTLFLALAGISYLFAKKRNLAILTLGIFLLNSLGIIFLRKFGFGLGIIYSYQFYYLPAFLIVVIWLAVIIQYLSEKINLMFKAKSRGFCLFLRLLLFAILISLPLSFLAGNYQKNDLSDFWFSYDYAKNVLASLEPNSIFYFSYDGSLQADTEIFDYLYLKKVENFRPDVIIVSELSYFRDEVKIDLPAEHFKYSFEQQRDKIFDLIFSLPAEQLSQRPIYTNFAVSKEDTTHLGIFSLSNGITYKIYPNFEAAKKAELPIFIPSIRNLDNEKLESQFVASGLLSHYYYNLAVFYLNRGIFDQSQQYLIKAINLDNAPFNHEYRRFIKYRSNWLEKS